VTKHIIVGSQFTENRDMTSLVAVVNYRTVCTWFYVAAQMIHGVNGFFVTLLNYVKRVELRPT